MSDLAPRIRVGVTSTNPGQFFACCGLLEVADRLWPGAMGWFAQKFFCIATPDGEGSLKPLLMSVKRIQLIQIEVSSPDEESDEEEEERSEEDGDTLEPLEIATPFQLRLDWWQDKSLKTWAGSMDARRIFLAMCNAIDPDSVDPMNQEQVVYDPEPGPSSGETRTRTKKPKKREPFYLDARRGANALGLDVGFMPDALKTTSMITKAFPTVCTFRKKLSPGRQFEQGAAEGL